MPAARAATSLEATAQEENDMPTAKSPRSVESGDLVIVSGHRVGDVEQIGEVIEVLGDDRRHHYRVRWDDGHESIFFPGSDATIRRRRAGTAKGATPRS
jgi:hypothetical protein